MLRQIPLWFKISILLFVVRASLFAGTSEVQVFTHPCMGTEFRFHVYPEPGIDLEKAIEAAKARIDAINLAASDYLPQSELSKLNLAPANEPIKLSDDLKSLIQRSLAFAAATEGAFDITAVYSIQNWRRAKRQKQLPTAERVQHAIEMTGWQNLEIDTQTGSLLKKKEGIKMDLGGIGKGYAADAALAVLRQHGISRALVAASGDLAIGDPPPGKDGWEIHLRTFEEAEKSDKHFTLHLRNCGCSTSGDLHQYFELDGKRWSHIIDPKTGLGLTDRIACSVIASDSTTCDALATAFCILGAEKTQELASRFKGVSWRIITLDEGNSPDISTYGNAFSTVAQP